MSPAATARSTPLAAPAARRGVGAVALLLSSHPRLGRPARTAQPLPRHDPRRDRAAARLSRDHVATCASIAPAEPRRRRRRVDDAKVALLLGIATVATAFVSEMLVGSLEPFGEAAGLSDFFVAVVIVAIVGNAAEHGGAIVVAQRGKTKLATEIAVSSSAQVAVFVAPAAALMSSPSAAACRSRSARSSSLRWPPLRPSRRW